MGEERFGTLSIEVAMVHELFHTSAPRGLFPGSSGFCVVAATRGLPAALMEKLEELSTYRPLSAAGTATSPVVYSHLNLTVSGRPYHVLSRIAPAGLDYSGRGNRFAHHVVLEPGELPAAGPAWVLSQPGFMETAWDGQVGFLACGRRVPMGDVSPRPCTLWQNMTGDAGWAGVLVENIETAPGKPVYLLFEPGQLLLPLLAEAVALLSPEKRWQATFSTYFTGAVAGCCWRGLPRGSAEAANARRAPGAMVLELRSGENAGHGPFAAYARSGIRQRQPQHAGASGIASLTPVGLPAWEEAAIPEPPPSTIRQRTPMASEGSMTPPRVETASLIHEHPSQPAGVKAMRWMIALAAWSIGVGMTVAVVLVLAWLGKIEIQSHTGEVRDLEAQAQQLKDQIAQAKVDLQQTKAKTHLAAHLETLIRQSSKLVRSGQQYLDLHLAAAGTNPKTQRPQAAAPHPQPAAKAPGPPSDTEQKLHGFYVALDRLGLGPQLHDAVHAYFRQGNVDAFQKKWDEWYLPQVEAEHKARPQGLNGLKARLRELRAAEKKVDSPTTGGAPARENLKLCTRNLLTRCLTNIEHYPNTVAARTVAKEPLIAEVCKKLLDEHQQIDRIQDEQSKRAAIENARYYSTNREQATVDLNAANKIVAWLKKHADLVPAQYGKPASPASP